MYYFVYVLQDQTNRKLYVGRTATLPRRIHEHLQGKVHTTKRMKELEVIFIEGFRAKPDAIRRERYLKTSKGKATLRMMLRSYLGRK